MGIGKFVRKVKNSVRDSTKALAELPKGVIKDPSRLLTGVDPISTGLWNKVLGTNKDPLVNLYGGPTGKQLDKVGANSLARGAFKFGDVLAGTLGGAGAINGLGNAAASQGINVGIGNSAQAAALRGAGSIPTGPSTAELMAAGPQDAALSPVSLAPNAVKVGANTAPVANGFNFGNFLGDYGQYLGPLISGAGQLYGANQAAKGAEAGIDEIRRQFDLNRADNQPWMQTGINALGGLDRLAAGDYSAFMNSPDYKYALEQGLKSVENSAAARGGLYSGNNLRRLQETGSGLASQNLGNYRNQLLSMAGLGQTATNTNIQAGTNAASNIAGLQTNIGDIRGSGIAGVGNEIGNAFDTYYGRRYGRKINPYSTYGGV